MSEKCKLLYLLGPEAPVLLLIWLLYMVALWPLALMNQWKLAIFSTPMSIGLGITFIAFSKGRGKSWLIMSSLSLLASIAGTAQGVYLKLTHPVKEEDLPLNYPAALLWMTFIPAVMLLLALFAAAPLIRICGGRVVGSSEEFRKSMASHMTFGTALISNVDQLEQGKMHFLGWHEHVIDEEEFSEAKLLLKLQGDLYFSGEPVYDYAFWLSNNHLMIGLLMHHPLSPLDTGHRLVIMLVTCLLIVFPVALITVLWPLYIPQNIPGQGIVRSLFMISVVIMPRNILKARMKNIALQDEEIYIEMRSTHASTPDLNALKKDLIQKEAKLYGAVGVITIFFCCVTWMVVSRDDIKDGPLNLVLMNTDGLGFCFILEILFGLIMPKPSKNQETKCFGWWGRWHNERICHLHDLENDLDPDERIDERGRKVSRRLFAKDAKGPEAAIAASAKDNNAAQSKNLSLADGSKTQVQPAASASAQDSKAIPFEKLSFREESATQSQRAASASAQDSKVAPFEKLFLRNESATQSQRATSAFAQDSKATTSEKVSFRGESATQSQRAASATAQDSRATPFEKLSFRAESATQSQRAVSASAEKTSDSYIEEPTLADKSDTGQPSFKQFARAFAVSVDKDAASKFSPSSSPSGSLRSLRDQPPLFMRRAAPTLKQESAAPTSSPPVSFRDLPTRLDSPGITNRPARLIDSSRGLRSPEKRPDAILADAVRSALPKQTQSFTEAPVSAAPVPIPNLEPLKLQGTGATWRKYNGGMFESVLTVNAEYGDIPVRLVDARFIVELERMGGKLCRRQDLPDSAFIGLEDLKRLPPHTEPRQNLEVSLRIVAISHQWLQESHPDPEGLNLKLLAQVLKNLLGAGGGTYAVFLDFLSLHQKDSSGGRRSRSEEKLFNLALDSVLDWFASPCTLTMMLTKLPQGYSDGSAFPPDTKINRKGYYERGWCFSEAAGSSLAKDSTLVLDLGKLSGTANCWVQVQEECVFFKLPPLAPLKFRLLLAKKSFTSLIPDYRKVAELYKNNFTASMEGRQRLAFQGQCWGDDELAVLIQTCKSEAVTSVKDLWLDNNQISDNGCKTIASACSTGVFPNLNRLRLGGNMIGDAGCTAIACTGAEGGFKDLKELDLRNNQISDDGCIALAEACADHGALKNLVTLSLEGNKISMAGRNAFQKAKASGALPSCSPDFGASLGANKMLLR